MSLETARAYFEQQQVALFRSTATIKYQSGSSFNPTTGGYVPSYTTRATGVSCLIRPRSAAQAETGEREQTIGRHEGKFPADQLIEIDDLVVVTASTHDATLVGKTFVVKERLLDDWQICRRVVMEIVE